MLSNQQDGRAKTGDFWFQKKCPKRKVVWNVGKLSPVDTLFIVHLDYLCFGQHSNLTISNDRGPLRNIICKQKMNLGEQRSDLSNWLLNDHTTQCYHTRGLEPTRVLPRLSYPYRYLAMISENARKYWKRWAFLWSNCNRCPKPKNRPLKQKNVQSAGFFRSFFFLGGDECLGLGDWKLFG